VGGIRSELPPLSIFGNAGISVSIPNADKRLENINRRETFDPISKRKRAKNARKEQMRKRKLEDYVYSMFNSDSPVYKPYFNAAEREYVLNG
jgi:hypothetical protein